MINHVNSMACAGMQLYVNAMLQSGCCKLSFSCQTCCDSCMSDQNGIPKLLGSSTIVTGSWSFGSDLGFMGTNRRHLPVLKFNELIAVLLIVAMHTLLGK